MTTYLFNVVNTGCYELLGFAVDPEYTPLEVLVRTVDEINDHLRRFDTRTALQDLLKHKNARQSIQHVGVHM